MNAFWEEIVSRLQELLDPPNLVGKVSQWIADLLVGLFVFALIYLLWLFVRRLLRHALAQADVDQTAGSFVELLAKYSILGIGIVYAMNAAGIDTSALLASLGIAGLTIGFAARDALSNLISGVLIFLDRPFVIGDLVEIEDRYGRVEKITLRSTRVVTVDGKMLAVPNSEIINKTVASYTNFPNLRLDIPITVGVHENLDQVRRILMELVAEDKELLSDPKPRMVVTQLNDFNVAVEFQVWLINERTHIEKRFQLRERVFMALTEADVEMPFETIQLAPMEVKLQPEQVV
jgi:small conductance mechanosensitive channel